MDKREKFLIEMRDAAQRSADYARRRLSRGRTHERLRNASDAQFQLDLAQGDLNDYRRDREQTIDKQ